MSICCSLVEHATLQPENSIIPILQDHITNFQGDGSSLLHFAICFPDTDIALRMIQRGANINTQQSHGESVLHTAVKFYDSQKVNFLLEHGVDMNLKTDDGETALHYNIESSCKVRLLDTDLNEQRKQTCIIYKLLLEKGANCNEKDNKGVTAFLAAVSSETLPIVKLFVEHGADIRAVDSKGNTALHIGTKNKNVDVLEFILEQGFEIECGTKEGLTPLHYAAHERMLESCKILLRRGAAIDSKDVKGQTPLAWVAYMHSIQENESVPRLLLRHGASVADAWINGKRILEYVARDEVVGMRDVLMQHVAKIHCLNITLDENVRNTIKSTRWYNVYYKMCLKELHRAKRTTFYNDVSIFNLITGSDRVISGYASNDELLKALQKVDWRNKFPIYSDSLKETLQEAVERQILLNIGVKIINDIFNFNDPFNVVSRKIVSYLKESDFKYLTFGMSGITNDVLVTYGRMGGRS